jgi:hypothetical protein
MGLKRESMADINRIHTFKKVTRKELENNWLWQEDLWAIMDLS